MGGVIVQPVVEPMDRFAALILIIASTDCVLPRPAAAGPLAQPPDLAGPGVALLPGAAPPPRPRKQQAGHAARPLLEVHPPPRQPRHLLQPHQVELSTELSRSFTVHEEGPH